MPDAVCLGELLIDFVPTVTGTSLVDAPAFKKAPGGAPANVAVGLSRLGATSAFMGMVGDDAFGHFLADTLAEAGVDVGPLLFTDKARTALAFVSLRADGEREFMFYRHPSADVLFAPDDVDVDLLAGAKLLHFGSISLIDDPCRSATLRAVAAAQAAGLCVSYDPNLRLALWQDARAAEAGMLLGWPNADIIKVSEEELEFLTGERDPVRAGRSLWHDRLRLLVVTRGREGCMYLTPDFTGEAAGFQVEAVDATGAGDAFVAGLLAGLLADPSASEDEATLRRLCLFANAAGALATTERGAIPALPDRQRVLSFLEQHDDRPPAHADGPFPERGKTMAGKGFVSRPFKLRDETLERLPSNVRRPAYDRRDVAEGIMHIGVGGFHRAHQAVYVDDAIGETGAGEWGICGVGLLRQDSRMRDALIRQDCLYTVVERGPGADPMARVVGSIRGFLYAPGDTEGVLERMAASDIRIVSLTITEGGYYLDPKTGESSLDHPDIVHDLQHPARPVAAFGFLAEALDRRRRRGLRPFTVMSCDNVQGNGGVTRRMLLAFAERRDPALRDWIAENVAFPNSMVDRITPATTDADRETIREIYGIDDAWPVVTEPFRQWVVEDAFCNGRPMWERVGVQMTSDVQPYEMMKIRLLNASHSAMGYLGLLAGYAHIHEVMADELFRRFVIDFMDEEVTPILQDVPGIDLAAYKKALVERFSNPAIRDQVLRICMDGSAKIPKFILPTLREQLRRGGPTGRMSLVIASWCRAMAGTNDQGAQVEVADPMADLLSTRARAARRTPEPFIAVPEVFGEDLWQSPTFVAQVTRALESLCNHGVRRTLAHY